MTMPPIKTFTRTLLTADVPSPVGARIYPEAVLRKAVEDAQPKVKARTMFGSGTGGPEGPVKLAEVTHLVSALWMEGPRMVATIEFLDTPKGRLLTAIMEEPFDDHTLFAAHCTLVPEGIGTIAKSFDMQLRPVVETYELTTVLVQSPPPLRNVREENADLNRLFEKQHTRVAEAQRRWREATGEHLTRPDLGTLVQWLLDGRDAVEKENAELKAQLKMVGEAALKTMMLFPQHSPESKALSALFAHTDSSSRSPSALFEELKRVKAAVREHMEQSGDDRCWIDDEALYAKLGLDVDELNTALPPKEEFLSNCARFHASRQDPKHKYVTVAEQLEALAKGAEQFMTPEQVVRFKQYLKDTRWAAKWAKFEDEHGEMPPIGRPPKTEEKP